MQKSVCEEFEYWKGFHCFYNLFTKNAFKCGQIMFFSRLIY